MGDVQRRVLIVEDEPGLAELFEIWLQSHFSVSTASDGREALEAIDDNVACIVLDWRMPEVSGEEVVAEIFKRDIECGIVVVTGLDPAVANVDERVDTVLCKPIEEDALITAVSDALV